MMKMLFDFAVFFFAVANRVCLQVLSKVCMNTTPYFTRQPLALYNRLISEQKPIMVG